MKNIFMAIALLSIASLTAMEKTGFTSALSPETKAQIQQDLQTLRTNIEHDIATYKAAMAHREALQAQTEERPIMEQLDKIREFLKQEIKRLETAPQEVK